MNLRTKYPIYSLDGPASTGTPQQVSFQGKSVDLWAMRTDNAAIDVQALQAMLSADERERAARFRVAATRREFIIARGRLRVLLAQYLDVAPTALRFGYEKHGKPYLTTEAGTPLPLRFNLSHTQGMVMYAIGWHCELGLDIERVQPEWADEQTARQFLTPTEFRRWQQLPPPLQPAMYFTLWTCKEAYLKTLGTGFSVSPETVEITLDVEAVPRWIEMPSPQKPWAFYRISLPHCAAALGVCNLEHASIQTSAIYVHATNGGKRRALENVEPSWPN